MSVLASILTSIALTAVGIGWQEAASAYGNKVSSKVIKLAQQLYTKIQNNNELLERLTEAYNTRNSELMTELLQGAGFGARTQAIKDAMSSIKNEYQSRKTQINAKNTDLTNLYNEVTSASYATGTIAGAKHVKDVYNSINQAINGGINNNE